MMFQEINKIWLEKDMWMVNLVKFDSFSVDFIQIDIDAVEKDVFHTECDEWIYVLSGTLIFLINGKEILLKQGDHISIPINTVHGSINQSKEIVNLLSVCSPPFEQSFMQKV